jgi:hypothetical protein
MNERATRRHCVLSLLASVAGAAGCDDPLTDPAVIAGPRIAGARVESASDPSIAEPAAGEAASIDWLVLSNEQGSFSARVAWCRGAPTVLGAPRCDGSVSGEQTALGRWGAPLRLDFTVPSDLEPGAAWLVWIGICSSGDAAFEPSDSTFHCGDGEALSGFYRGFVPEGAANHNPSLADDTLLLDGVPWLAADALDEPPKSTEPPEPAEPEPTEPEPTEPPEPAEPEPAEPEPGAPCAGLQLPAVHPHRPATIALELGGDDREPLESAPGTYAARPRESLVFTHLATLPGLDRAFSAIDYDAARLGFDVPFAYAEGELEPGGMTLGFYLLVRDERGGVDWIERRACLLPP